MTGEMDVALAIDILVPGAEYFGSVTGNVRWQYDELIWKDKRPKPLWDDLLKAWKEYQPETPLSLEDRLRNLETKVGDVDTRLKHIEQKEAR